MKEPPIDREELINEIETYAAWCNEVITCRNRMQAIESEKFVPEPFADFEEKPQFNNYYLLGFLLFIMTYFADVWWKWNIYPNGFFKGIFLIIVVFFVFAILWFRSETPEKPEKRELRYVEWKKNRKEHNAKEAAKYNDILNRYNKEKKLLAKLLDSQPETFIPDKYSYPQVLYCISGYLKDYRANTFAEAVNIYITDQQMQAHMNEMRQEIAETKKIAAAASSAASSAAAEARHAYASMSIK